MKLTACLALGAIAQAAYVPSEPWTTLTPSAPAPTGAITDHPSWFGIQIVAQEVKKDKRDGVAQIGDGQVQKQTSITLLTPAPPKPTAPIINQIGDGQIQNQISNNKPVTIVNQIGDGQIQNQKISTSSVINQIGDGQIQNQPKPTVAGQISDGQPQATGTVPAGGSKFPQACLAENNLAMKLDKTVLTDSKGRIGAIVANRQFQFDGPPPQAGTIFAAGWSITQNGTLALGNSDMFYQCLSGDFYNLYDQTQGAQCQPVKFSIIELVKC
ncbi:hypothetical protein PUMCH_004183 [Australozyma saopauloensis]|uniref:Cell wall mannoprotein PIR1-like C-terminal domain-containing protein n=1 Tax=Australozyma saopauloensis TaxID=291208 RepID=A0AAX4HEK1_9ASCO|nr:hypothetical protein PUMCH_004183 [[Candida] saopauloensis]